MHTVRIHGGKEGGPVNNNKNNKQRQVLAFRFLDNKSVPSY
jgi:hypothetical protein